MTRRTTLLAASLTVAAMAVGTAAASAAPSPAPTLVPIGGGYEEVTLRTFGLEVAAKATGPSVDILVVPSSYGDAPEDRATNLRQAGSRARQIDAACDAAVAASPALAARFPAGCTAPLLTLLSREDALDPANSAAFLDASTDGSYVLGGDQVLAMHVLANTPAEAAMESAAARGVVFGGTSAGNAVESRSMGAGYPAPGYPWNALEKPMSLIFWGDDLASEERGLSFGSQRVILDQHFHQRGRWGRLLSYTAQSVERYGAAGKLGVGVDYGTGVVLDRDSTVTRPFGLSSSAIVDFSTASTPRWVSPRQTLTVTNVRTHLTVPGVGLDYDIASRTPLLGGAPVPATAPSPLPRMETPGRGPLLLGGGSNATGSSRVLQNFVGAASGKGPIAVVSLGHANATDAQAKADTYARALGAAGWTGEVRTLVHGRDAITPASLRQTAGVLIVGGDQSTLAAAASDSVLKQAVHVSMARGPVMTDGSATALMGESYFTNPDPGRGNEDAGIAAFRTAYPRLAIGWGLVAGQLLEPQLTEGYRWGRLFTGSYAAPGLVATGISEQTALRVQKGAGTVLGERSVTVVDGRKAQWLPGDNGALGAVNVSLSTFGEGVRVAN
jgi:cyanophycinase